MLTSIRRIPSVLVIGLGFLLGLMLVVALTAPRVVQVILEYEDAAVPSTSTIQVEFNRPMNAASVESHFATDPPLDGRFEWSGDTLQFFPETPWPNGGEVYVTLRAGALGRVPLPLLRTRNWFFTVGLPRIIYLWPADGPADLYAATPGSGEEPVALTAHDQAVIDYTLSANGTQIVYVLQQAGGEDELHSLDLISGVDLRIHTCDPQAPCMTPAVSPDGAWVAFVMQTLTIGTGGRLVAESSQIWVIDMENEGQAFPVTPQEHNCSIPGWSPQGWLTYYDQQLGAAALLTFDAGPAPAPFTYLPNSLGAGGSWSPDGERYIYPEIIFPESVPAGVDPKDSSLYYSHLFQTDLSTGRTTDISSGEETMVEDASPAFSPDGKWIVFARKYLDVVRWSPGRQLWRMSEDGSGAESLTNQPNYTFSSINWSPDSTMLAFMRRSPSELEQGPEIWWLDLETGSQDRLVMGGYLPAWIP